MFDRAKLRTFGLGAFGTIVVYAVWFIRNTDSFSAYVESHGGLVLVVAGAALLLVAAAGGLWANINGAKSTKSAFSLGLGVPAMVFAIDIGNNTDDSTPAAEPAHATAASDGAGASTGSAWSGFGAVFTPVGVARLAERDRAERAIADDLRAIAPSATASLIGALKSPEPEKRAAAANVLSRMGTAAKDAAPELERLSGNDPDARVKASAHAAARRVRAIH